MGPGGAPADGWFAYANLTSRQYSPGPGMDFYARALDAYGERFLVPYTQGFSDRQRWEALIRQLEQGDFLQDLLVPMTANAILSSPPDAPPQ